MPTGALRNAAWKVFDLTLVAIMAAVALILVWPLVDWPLNDEAFYLLAITALALRQKDEHRRNRHEADGLQASPAEATPGSLDWVLLIAAVAVMLFSLEGLFDDTALVIERILDGLNTTLAGAFAAYVVLSHRS